jgi:hypothetical protein
MCKADVLIKEGVLCIACLDCEMWINYVHYGVNMHTYFVEAVLH